MAADWWITGFTEQGSMFSGDKPAKHTRWNRKKKKKVVGDVPLLDLVFMSSTLLYGGLLFKWQ